MAINDSGRERARLAVGDELVRRSMGPAEFARKAGVDTDTALGFLGGKRWPQVATRNAMAKALGWTPESIDRMARGEEPVEASGAETVGDQTQDVGVLLDMPPEALEGLGPAEREEVITAAKLSALSKAREIRRRLDE